MNFKKNLALFLVLPLLACTPTTVKYANGAESTKASIGTLSTVATGPQAKKVKESFEKHFASRGFVVENVYMTPVPGFFALALNNNKEIVYVDQDAHYMFTGDLIDIKNSKNLTKVQLDNLNKIDFNSLDLTKAIKEVRGNGQNKIVVFSDPLCPFCHRLEEMLANTDNVTVYTFLAPIPSLHPDAPQIAKRIWCEKDKAKAWTDWMRKGIKPSENQNCSNPIEENMSFFDNHGFEGTPTIIFPNGLVQSGIAPNTPLQKLIESNQK